MRHGSIPVRLLVLALLLGAVAPGATMLRRPAAAPPAALEPAAAVPAARAVAAAELAGMPSLNVDLVVAPGAMSAAARRVVDLGGRVLLHDDRTGYLQAEMPVHKAMALGSLPGVRALGADGPAVWRKIAATDGGQAVTGAQAVADLATNLRAIRQPELVAATGATGRGAVIAMIDTGVDAGHPALQSGSDGSPKIVDWRDFSGEGDVDTSLAVRAQDGFITAPNGRRYNVTGIPTASGILHFGLLSESRLDSNSPLQGDLNHNASNVDAFGVLVADSLTPGVYDTVYVDGNNSGSFANRSPLVPWRVGQSFARSGGRFGGGLSTNGRELSTNFAVCDVSGNGNQVSLGFDGNGHGTGVASIATGDDPGTGFKGVAPDAQILVLKVLGSSAQPRNGTRAWTPISAAITYAAQHGANIINLSLDHLETDLRGETDMSAFLRAVAEQYGVLIVLAAGNGGPGLSSGLTPGDDAFVLTVGAYASSDMWSAYRGLAVPGESLLSFSGVGPRLNGSLVPSLIAPGMAALALPRWQSASGYYTDNGTSEAVPEVTGGAALLLDAAQRAGVHADHSALKRSLEAGARALDGYEVIEQGHGGIDLEKSWLMLRQFRTTWDLHWSLSGDPMQRGLLARGTMPDDASFTLVNNSDKVHRVGIVPDKPWIVPLRDSITLPPGRNRSLPVQYALPSAPGLYSGLVTLMDPDAGGPVAQMISTVVSPNELGSDNSLHLSGEATAARYNRWFVRIPSGMNRLTVDFVVPGGPDGTPLGRERLHIFRPDGREVYTGPVVGVDAGAVRDRYIQPDPVPGVWELVAVAEPDLAKYALTTAKYSLDVVAQGFDAGSLPIHLRFPSGGSTARVSVPITNRGPAFAGGVEVSGLAARDDSVPAQVVRADYLDQFVLNEGAALMRMELSNIVSSSRPAGTKVLVTASHFNLLTQDWDTVASATLSGRSTVLDVPEPPAGMWTVSLVPLDDSDGQVQYARTVVAGGKDITASDGPRLHQPGETWNVPLQVQVPAQPGRYVGTLRVRDDSGQLLQTLPLEVDVAQRELAVSLLPAQLVEGQPGFVTFEVRDATSNALLQQPVDLEVNGRIHRMEGGRLSVPVPNAQKGMGFDVAISAPPSPFLPVTAHLSGSVETVRPALPMGGESGEDLPSWRRKLATETQP